MERDVARFGMLLEDAEVALVVDGSGFDARRRKANLVLAWVEDRGALAEFRSALRCVPGGRRMSFMTPGGPTVALFAADRVYLTAVTMIGFDHVRAPGLLDGDVPVAEPERLARWLAAVTGSNLGRWPRLAGWGVSAGRRGCRRRCRG